MRKYSTYKYQVQRRRRRRRKSSQNIINKGTAIAWQEYTVQKESKVKVLLFTILLLHKLGSMWMEFAVGIKKINSIFEVVKKRNFQRYEFFDLLIRNQPKNYL